MSKFALVTGSSRGIGSVTANLLHDRGWGIHGPCREHLDFSKFESVMGLINTWLNANAVPYFDALIFCHGTWYAQPPINQGVQDWHEQYYQRVTFPWMLIDFLLGGQKPPSSVVMVASTRGFIGGVPTGPYSVACAAQIALMQGYAREWPDCRFNVVCPGLTDTDMGREVIATGGAKPDAVPQPVEAVARAIVGLVDGDATGQVLRVVDGQVTQAKWGWE